MKLSKSILGLVLTVAIAMSNVATANETLADVMGLLLDQYTATSDLSKLTAVDVQEKAFLKVESRCRAASLLLSVLDEKKGSVDAQGNLTVDVTTPDKIRNAPPTEVADLLQKYSALLAQAGNQFSMVEAEVAAQRVKAPADRSFVDLKKQVLDLNGIMRKAHTAFR